jgi:hypothetical protein
MNNKTKQNKKLVGLRCGARGREHLPHRLEALSSNPNISVKNKNKKTS